MRAILSRLAQFLYRFSGFPRCGGATRGHHLIAESSPGCTERWREMVTRCVVICGVFLATLSFARSGLAQVQPPSGATPGSPVEAAAPISTEERLALERTILSDPR